MDQGIKEKYIRAGKITGEARDYAHEIVKPGVKFDEIANRLEQLIREKGGEPAFPVNISVNEIAAHDTATGMDDRTIKDGDIVKIDVGAHIDGYIGDTATTVCLNDKYIKMKESVEKAVEEALKLVKPDVKISDISEKIEETIRKYGYVPIANLTGHGLEQWEQHTDPTIPNIAFENDMILKKGQVIAIEPFATDGEGFVKEGGDSFIFSFGATRPVRSTDARKIMDYIKDLGVPFCERWIIHNAKEYGYSERLFNVRMALRELRQREIIHDYPVLKENGKGIVCQAEHTIIVDDVPIVTTKTQHKV